MTLELVEQAFFLALGDNENLGFIAQDGDRVGKLGSLEGIALIFGGIFLTTRKWGAG